MYEVETNQVSVPIEDLGLVVRRGESLWITPEQLNRSTCLKHLQRIGKVRVSPGKPSRVQKMPSAKVQPKKSRAVPVEPSPREKPRQSKPLAEDITGVIKRTAHSAAHEALRAFQAQSPPPVPVVPDGSLEDRIERAVARAISHGPGPSAKPKKADFVDGSDPLFIPQGIVAETSPDLNLSKESSSGSSVGDAAAALKAKRKNKEP